MPGSLELQSASLVGSQAKAAAANSTWKPVRTLLALFSELSETKGTAREGILVAKQVSDDERALLTYALSLPEAEWASLYALLDALEARVAAAKPEPASLSRGEFLALHAAFNKAPAQLHTVMLQGYLDAPRAAAALALCLAPASVAESVLPEIAPILLMPDETRAANNATSLLNDPPRAAPLLAAFQQLSISAHAAVASELPPAMMALTIVASARAFNDASKLGPAYTTLETLAQGKVPDVAQLEAMHGLLGSMSATAVSRVARCLSDVGPLIDAAPHLPVERWSTLFGSMRTVNGKIYVSSARVSAALVRHEAGRVGRVYYNNPEQRSMVGFLAGWFLLLVSFFGVLEEILARDLLHFMLDLYILCCAILTVLLELEINSALIRDYAALPVEKSLAFLRLASGRGVLYCLVGLLAIDISEKERVQLFAGAVMLIFGSLNLVLGSMVALKLKKLRRSLSGPEALSTAYHNALAAGPEGEQGLDGLNAKGAKRLFSDLGTYFNKLQMQAVFLEIDGERKGLLTEGQLLNWYHGHIGRKLKEIANTKPNPGTERTIMQWLTAWPDAPCDLSVYAAVMCAALIPFSFWGLIVSVAQHNLLRLVLNLYITCLAGLMLVIETRAPQTRRFAIHLLRYASAMMHPTARGVLYLLLSLTLLTQQAAALWAMGYCVELIGIIHVIVGSRVASKLSALRRALPDNRSVVMAFRAVSPDERPISGFGLKLLAQSAGVKLRWRIEQQAVLALFDLDRDGMITESDLLYWLGADEDDEDGSGDGGPEVVTVHSRRSEILADRSEAEMAAAMEDGAAGVEMTAVAAAPAARPPSHDDEFYDAAEDAAGSVSATPDDGVFTDLDIEASPAPAPVKPSQPFTSPVLMPPTPPPAAAAATLAMADDDDEIVD